MAWTAHKDEESIKEIFDSPSVLEQKIDALVDLIRKSKHFVIFTGAGVSTSAGIPDFRGPQGVWTLAAKKQERTEPTTSTLKAIPTQCHMAIVKLQKEGVCKYLITQNCDGLHRRSGIHIDKISELHGNGNVEECEKCGKQYFRDFKAHRLSMGRDHFTGRYCVVPNCGGRLLEWTIDFGQSLPEKPLYFGFEHSKFADLHLVLGSSLTVSPACNMPKTTKKSGGALVICNLQRTPLDDYADIKIHAQCDVVMTAVLNKLGLTPSSWKLRRRFTLKYSSTSPQQRNITFEGIDPDDSSLPATIFKQIEILEPFKHVLKKEPFSIKIPEKYSQLVKFNFMLHFMQHYGEPPLQLEETINRENQDFQKEYKLSYNPKTGVWKVKSVADKMEMKELEVTAKKIAQQASARLWACSTYCNDTEGKGFIVVSGGAGSSPKHETGIFLFDTSTGGWKKITSNVPEQPYLTKSRWAHAACVVPEISPSNVYLFAGWDGSCQYNDVHLFDWQNQTVVPVQASGKPPAHRGGLSATAWGKFVVLFGGAYCNGGPYHFFNDVHIFDCENQKWSPVSCKGTIPSPRSQHGAILVDPNTLLIVGGFDGDQLLIDTYLLNLTSFTWSTLTTTGDIPLSISGISPPEFRVYPAGIGIFRVKNCSKVLVCGLGKPQEEDARVYILDLETKVWTRLESRDFPVLSCPMGCAAETADEMFVLGGLGANGEKSTDVFQISVF